MKPKLLRMREGKPGGGKGPLVTEDMSLTLTGVQDVLFQPMALMENQRGELRLSERTDSVKVGGGKPGQGYQAVLMPRSSVGQEGLTSGLSDQEDGTPSASASSLDTRPASLPTDGQESPTLATSPPLWVTSGEEMFDKTGYHRESLSTDVTPTLNGYSTPLVGMAQPSGQADSPVRTSRSPESDMDSQESEADLPSPSLSFWTDTEMSQNDGSFSKTFRGFSRHMGGGIWRRSRVAWGTSGMGGDTDAWTANTSMCRSVGSECSSSHTRLADVLTTTAPQRFLLSARAAAGILRRASARGRRLPPTLEEALLEVCGNTYVQGVTPTTPSSSMESSPTGQLVLELSRPPSDTTDTPLDRRTLTEDSSSSLQPSQLASPTGSDTTRTTSSGRWLVRRLTPLETELLMGWPPGHTISTSYSQRNSTATGTKPAETE